MEFLRGRADTRDSAILSPGSKSHSDINMLAETKRLHSRFNPKLVGFGIVNPFESSPGRAANLSGRPVIEMVWDAKHPEDLK